MVKDKDYLVNHLNTQQMLKTGNLKFQLRLIPARHQIVNYFNKKFQTLKWSFLWSISHMYTWPKLKIGIANLKMTSYKASFTNFKLLFLVRNCLEKTDLWKYEVNVQICVLYKEFTNKGVFYHLSILYFRTGYFKDN